MFKGSVFCLFKLCFNFVENHKVKLIKWGGICKHRSRVRENEGRKRIFLSFFFLTKYAVCVYMEDIDHSYALSMFLLG